MERPAFGRRAQLVTNDAKLDDRGALCAGKTGRWLQMRVLYVEDLANHDDPESCVGVRKDVGNTLGWREALLQQTTDFVGHLRAPQGALRLDADVQAQRHVDGQALQALAAARFWRLVSEYLLHSPMITCMLRYVGEL